MKPDIADILGVVLAGGLSRRMGERDKTLIELGGKPLIAHSVDRLTDQVDQVVINANGDLERFDDLNLPVVADTISGHAGPLAGVLTGMEYCYSRNSTHTHVLCIAADTPFFPIDLVSRFCDGIMSAQDAISIATSNGNNQPVFSMWPVSLRPALREAIEVHDTRKVMAFAKSYPLSMVSFENYGLSEEVLDPFFNINTPEDLNLAQSYLEKMKNTVSA